MLASYLNGAVFGDKQGGKSPAVVALHGWARDRSDFAVALEGTDSLSIDLPGFGLSPPPPEAWGSQEYAKFLLPIIEQFEKPPVLIGHSFGGRVAFRIAALRSEAVAGLVLTGVPFIRSSTARRAPLGYRIVRYARQRGLITERVLNTARSRYGSGDYNQAEGIMRDVLVRVVNEEYEDDFGRVRCPTRLVWGEQDTAAPLWMAQRARDGIENCHLAVVPDSGHHLPIVAPEALRAELCALLENRQDKW